MYVQQHLASSARARVCHSFGFAFALAVATLCLGASTAAAAQDEPRTRLYPDGSRHLIVEVGPLDLPAGASHHDVTQPSLAALSFPLDTYVHGYEVEIVDDVGAPVSQHVLHHVNLIFPHERELFSNIMLRLGAAGPETGRVMLPRLFAFPVAQGDSLLVTAMLHNPESRDYSGVRMRVRLRHTPADTRLRPFRVKPFYMDVMPPDGKHAFDLPPGRSERSWQGSPAVPGRILGMGGHLHRYGVLLRFEDVTTGRVLWEARPRYHEDGKVESMPVKRFIHRLGLPLDTGHVYRLTAVYDNPTGDVIPDGGMGTLGGVFIPSRRVDWPKVDTGHPQYLRDWEVLRGLHDDHAHHGAHGPLDRERSPVERQEHGHLRDP